VSVLSRLLRVLCSRLRRAWWSPPHGRTNSQWRPGPPRAHATAAARHAAAAAAAAHAAGNAAAAAAAASHAAASWWVHARGQAARHARLHASWPPWRSTGHGPCCSPHGAPRRWVGGGCVWGCAPGRAQQQQQQLSATHAPLRSQLTLRSPLLLLPCLHRVPAQQACPWRRLQGPAAWGHQRCQAWPGLWDHPAAACPQDVSVAVLHGCWDTPRVGQCSLLCLWSQRAVVCSHD
jgi:hypothetical protein